MRLKKRCERCGKPVDCEVTKTRRLCGIPGIVCAECHHDDIKRRKAERDARLMRKRAELKKLFLARRCVVCGGPIEWKDAYWNKREERWPNTCSPRCHGIQSKRNFKYTKEQIEDRIRAYIKQRGCQVSYKEVIRDLHIASKVLSHNGISVLRLMQEELGAGVKRTNSGVIKESVDTMDDLCILVGAVFNSYEELVKYIIKGCCGGTVASRRELLARAIKSYIQHRGCYTGITALMRELNVSFEAIRRTYALDIKAINRELGFRDVKASWYEFTAYNSLSALFGADSVFTEYGFPDLLSSRHFPLRFDFWIPKEKLLVEVDGDQHHNTGNKYFKETTVKNDMLKDRYARDHGYKLIRITTTPRFTFVERLRVKILEVVKRIEFLEPRTDNAEGDQKPSTDDQ